MRARRSRALTASRVAEVRVGRPDREIDEHRLRRRDAVIVFSHRPEVHEPPCSRRCTATPATSARSEAAHGGERERRSPDAGVDADALRRGIRRAASTSAQRMPEEVVIDHGQVIAARSGPRSRATHSAEGPIRRATELREIARLPRPHSARPARDLRAFDVRPGTVRALDRGSVEQCASTLSPASVRRAADMGRPVDGRMSRPPP